MAFDWMASRASILITGLQQYCGEKGNPSETWKALWPCVLNTNRYSGLFSWWWMRDSLLIFLFQDFNVCYGTWCQMFSFTILQLMCHWGNTVLITYIELKRKYPCLFFSLLITCRFKMNKCLHYSIESRAGPGIVINVYYIYISL